MTINNLASSRILPTPVKYSELEHYLKGYHDEEYVLNGFKHGFKLDFVGSECILQSNNSISARNNLHIVQQKVNEEMNLGRISGPFEVPPFEFFKSSPLALREKKDCSKFRLLHNLSFPYNEQSLNFNIPKHASSVSYSNIQEAVKIILNNDGKYLAKSDISEAFRLIPLCPTEYHLTGFQLNHMYYYDRCLPQGCSSSCRIFERFSDSLVYVMRNSFNVHNIVKVLDDFLFIENTHEDCLNSLNKFKILCNSIGVPIAKHKTFGPLRTLDFSGLL